MADKIIAKIQDIPKLSDKELERYLEAGEFHETGHEFALQEYNRRKLAAIAKSHWTLTPTFIVAVAALVVAGLAAYFLYLSIPKEAQPSALSQPFQTELNSQKTNAQPAPTTKPPGVIK